MFALRQAGAARSVGALAFRNARSVQVSFTGFAFVNAWVWKTQPTFLVWVSRSADRSFRSVDVVLVVVGLASLSKGRDWCISIIDVKFDDG
jgi:hypothetical protein